MQVKEVLGKYHIKGNPVILSSYASIIINVLIKKSHFPDYIPITTFPAGFLTDGYRQGIYLIVVDGLDLRIRCRAVTSKTSAVTTYGGELVPDFHTKASHKSTFKNWLTAIEIIRVELGKYGGNETGVPISLCKYGVSDNRSDSSRGVS